MFVFQKFMLQILVCWKIGESTGLVPIPSIVVGTGVVSRNNRIPVSTTTIPPTLYCKGNIRRFAVDNSEENEFDSEESESPAPSPQQEPSLEMDTSTMKIDDGGSNMTDRFKYKVHALMGDYDPTEGMTDDEDQDGNIMKALLTFPTQHIFDVVGRLSSNDESENDSITTNEDDYADKVKTIVFDTTGDDNMECEVVPRGKKFVKVRCTAMVESTTMINTIYDELGKMESTVMKF